MKRTEFIQEYILATRRSGDATSEETVEKANKLFDLTLTKTESTRPSITDISTVHLTTDSWLVIDRTNNTVRCFKRCDHKNIVQWCKDII